MTDEPTTEAPKYVQIATDLRGAILSGQYQPGSKLPNKAQMGKHYAAKFGGTAALGTINAVLRTLREEGLIITRKGVGSFVVDPLPDLNAPSEYEQLTAVIEELRAEVRELKLRVAGLELVVHEQHDDDDANGPEEP